MTDVPGAHKKVGRPKGSKDKAPRKRKDRSRLSLLDDSGSNGAGEPAAPWAISPWAGVLHIPQDSGSQAASLGSIPLAQFPDLQPQRYSLGLGIHDCAVNNQDTVQRRGPGRPRGSKDKAPRKKKRPSAAIQRSSEEQDSALPRKQPGRPKGSKDRVPRKRRRGHQESPSVLVEAQLGNNLSKDAYTGLSSSSE